MPNYRSEIHEASSSSKAGSLAGSVTGMWWAIDSEIFYLALALPHRRQIIVAIVYDGEQSVI